MRSSERFPPLPALSLSKISPPALHGIFPRPRLQELFKQNQDKKLILIIAQAAQGKSTAAAAYFQTVPLPAIWINLGQEDSDPVNLYSLLFHVLREETGDPIADRPTSLPSRSIGPRDTFFLYREWVASLFYPSDQHREIFLDGLDHLHPQAESFRFLQALVEGMPPSIRLFLLSRAYPPEQLDFQRLIMSREALVLNNDDLAFSPQEIRLFFRETRNLSLSPKQVERIHQATEGWIGGIILMVEVLNKFSPDSPEKFLEGAWSERFHKEIFQYFGKEVFLTLTPLQQRFLLSSSPLDHLEPEILRDLFPDGDWEDILQELTRKNLFVQIFPNPGQGFVFRYHKLFRGFLDTLYRSRYSEEERLRWHLRIGNCYAQRGTVEEAIPHFLTARDYPAAAGLIRRLGLITIKTGKMNELFGWLQALPDSLVRDDPWLTLLQIFPSRFFAREEIIRELDRIVHLFREQEDQSGLLLGLAFLIEAEFFQGRYRPELIREAESQLEQCREDGLVFERALLWSQAGITQSLRGNARRGYWACRNAYLLSRQLSDPLIQAVSLCHGIYALTILGEFREADRLLKESGSLSWNVSNAEIRFFHTLATIAYLCFTGDPRRALELSDRLVEETEKQGLPYLYPVALIHKQFSLLYLHEFQQTREIGAMISALADAVQATFLKGAAELYSGVSAYWAQDQGEAQELIDQALRRFETGDSYSELHQVGARLARALLSNSTARHPSAIEDLRKVVQYLEDIESWLLLTECYLALGVLFHSLGQAEQAGNNLAKGLKLARRRTYCHFMIISPRDTARACLLAQQYFEPGNLEAEYARHLLFRKYGRLAGEELNTVREHPHPRISQTVQILQRSLHRESKPRLRIETFNGLRLIFGQQRMDDRAWARIQPRRLLVAILSQRHDRIHKEVLIEALWPDEKPETGENNFKTTLQRLRKTLESEIDPRFGSSYIHLHQNLVFLDEEICRVDCREFAALAREGMSQEKAGNWKGALEDYGRAVNLYRGDFIPEEVYVSWTENRREDFRNIYINLLLRSAAGYERLNAFKKSIACLQQALETDPLLEEACRRLMTLYAGKNLHNEALRVFETCRKALKAGLHTRPDPVTVALYQGIRERLNKG